MRPDEGLFEMLVEDSDRLRALSAAIGEYASTLDSASAGKQLMQTVDRMTRMPIEEIRQRLESQRMGWWDFDDTNLYFINELR